MNLKNELDNRICLDLELLTAVYPYVRTYSHALYQTVPCTNRVPAGPDWIDALHALDRRACPSIYCILYTYTRADR